MIRLRRSEREAREAAAELFEAAGWPYRDEVGGKHKLLVVTLPSGSEYRFPLCNSPKYGVHGAVKLARWNAMKLIRKHNGDLKMAAE